MASISTFGLGNDTLVPVRLNFSTTTTPGVSQNIINGAVPAGQIWRIRKVLVICRGYANFDILVNGISIGAGKTSPVEANVNVMPDPYAIAGPTETIVVPFTQIVGPSMDVQCYVYATVT